MARPRIKSLYNLSDRQTKQRLMQAIAPLQGLYDLTIKPVNPKRSNQQNRYFHGVIIPALYDYLNDPGHGTGKHYTDEQCKDFIVGKVFEEKLIDIVNPTTGEVVGTVRPSTAEMTTEEFSMLIDGAIEWLSEMFGIIVPPPSMLYANTTNE